MHRDLVAPRDAGFSTNVLLHLAISTFAKLNGVAMRGHTEYVPDLESKALASLITVHFQECNDCYLCWDKCVFLGREPDVVKINYLSSKRPGLDEQFHKFGIRYS